MNTHYTENICFFDLFITWNPKNFNAIRVLPLISEEWIFVCNYTGGFKKQSNFVLLGLDYFSPKKTQVHTWMKKFLLPMFASFVFLLIYDQTLIFFVCPLCFFAHLTPEHPYGYNHLYLIEGRSPSRSCFISRWCLALFDTFPWRNCSINTLWSAGKWSIMAPTKWKTSI